MEGFHKTIDGLKKGEAVPEVLSEEIPAITYDVSEENGVRIFRYDGSSVFPSKSIDEVQTILFSLFYSECIESKREEKWEEEEASPKGKGEGESKGEAKGKGESKGEDPIEETPSRFQKYFRKLFGAFQGMFRRNVVDDLSSQQNDFYEDDSQEEEFGGDSDEIEETVEPVTAGSPVTARKRLLFLDPMPKSLVRKERIVLSGFSSEQKETIYLWIRGLFQSFSKKNVVTTYGEDIKISIGDDSFDSFHRVTPSVDIVYKACVGEGCERVFLGETIRDIETSRTVRYQNGETESSMSVINKGEKVAYKLFFGLKDNHYDELRNEWLLLSSLPQHPNILQARGFVEDSFEHNGNTYVKASLCMEYVEGRNLKDIIAENGALSSEKALHYFQQIIQALQFLHQHSAIHRDIKPANIIITPDDQIKIVDFGLARRKFQEKKLLCVSLQDLAQDSDIEGTPAYISYEEVDDAGYDRFHQLEGLYSAALTLYTMLVGEDFYQAGEHDTFDSIVFARLAHTYPEYRGDNKSLGEKVFTDPHMCDFAEGLDQFLFRMLSKTEDQRRKALQNEDVQDPFEYILSTVSMFQLWLELKRFQSDVSANVEEFMDCLQNKVDSSETMFEILKKQLNHLVTLKPSMIAVWKHKKWLLQIQSTCNNASMECEQRINEEDLRIQSLLQQIQDLFRTAQSAYDENPHHNMLFAFNRIHSCFEDIDKKMRLIDEQRKSIFNDFSEQLGSKYIRQNSQFFDTFEQLQVQLFRSIESLKWDVKALFMEIQTLGSHSELLILLRF